MERQHHRQQRGTAARPSGQAGRGPCLSAAHRWDQTFFAHAQAQAREFLSLPPPFSYFGFLAAIGGWWIGNRLASAEGGRVRESRCGGVGLGEVVRVRECCVSFLEPWPGMVVAAVGALLSPIEFMGNSIELDGGDSTKCSIHLRTCEDRNVVDAASPAKVRRIRGGGGD